MASDRERRVEQALSIFGVGVFERFLRTVRDSSGCTAVELANEHLDSGHDLRDLFFTGEDFGFHLTVEVEGPRSYLVSFGYAHGLVGDGAQWRVVRDRRDEVVRAELKTFWIH